MPEPTEPQNTVAAPAAQSSSDATAAGNNCATNSEFSLSAPMAAGEVGVLGPYRVVRELGKGGMGAVYLAIDTRLDRKLALKVMLPEFAANRDAKERFIREAKAVAKIGHDNVVTIYEADERDGVPYIAMQFLQGYPLDEFLKKKGAPPVAHCVRIGIEAARGLAAAHELGLVHRDIKPANLWLEAPNGRVKVLDFGLAKPVGTDTELTKSGVVVGTPAYMSPEQARGSTVDARTDIFSLGTVMYRLLTGKNPFGGANIMAVLMALGMEEPTPIRELNPSVPDALAAFVMRMLAKKPENRPQTATEVAQGLRAALAQPSAEVSTSMPVVVRPLPVPQPLEVSVAPESAFANLTDDDDDEATEAEAAPVPEASPKKRGKGVLLAVGAAVLLVAVAVAVALSQGGKKGDPTAEQKQPPAVPAPPRGAPVGKPTESDPDRKVAEWVLLAGGKVGLKTLEGLKVISPGTPLPNGDLRVASCDLRGCGGKVVDADLGRFAGLVDLDGLILSNTAVTDAGIESLKACRGLETLWLNTTEVSDAGMAHVKALTRLRYLHLGGTKVTDAGIRSLNSLTVLREIAVDGTEVSDAGLEHLAAHRELEQVHAPKTQVTKAGGEKLAKLLPACKITWDGGAIEPTVKIDADRKAAEWVLSLGRLVTIKDAAGQRMVAAVKDLPKERFSLTEVDLNGSAATDAWLANLKGLGELSYLQLVGTQVTDEGLAHLKSLKSLTKIRLQGTKVTDAGLAHLRGTELTALAVEGLPVTDAGLANLKDLKGMTTLWLEGTKVTDAGLEYLKELKALTGLDLKNTVVTAKGVKGLTAALPACQIVWDGGVIEPAKK